MRKTHAAEHVGRLAELDVVIAHNLDPVSPRIQKIKKTPGQDRNASRDQSRAECLLVVHHKPEMTSVIGGLPASPLQGDELIPQIDERGILALTAQLEVEEASVERERFLDITDFERDVVYADGARLLVLRHDRPPIRSRLRYTGYGPTRPAAQSHQGIVTRWISGRQLAPPTRPQSSHLATASRKPLQMRWSMPTIASDRMQRRRPMLRSGVGWLQR